MAREPDTGRILIAPNSLTEFTVTFTSDPGGGQTTILTQSDFYKTDDYWSSDDFYYGFVYGLTITAPGYYTYQESPTTPAFDESKGWDDKIVTLVEQKNPVIREISIADVVYDIDAKNAVHKTGDETINGTKTFTSNINGTVTSALWADLAEYYEADQVYEPGTLLQVGGEKEITIATTEVNLIVSTKPGFILNRNHADSENWLLCCLSGRIPVLVDGSVKKGDRLYLSKEQPGKASTTVNGNTIAIALEDGDKLVNAISKLTF